MKSGKNYSQQGGYVRMYMCRELIKKSNGVVFVIEDSSNNGMMWSADAGTRDNGEFTVGSPFIMFCPQRITMYMGRDPIVKTKRCCMALTIPKAYYAIPKLTSVPENTTKCYCINKASVELMSFDFENTECGGCFCDRQYVINKTSKQCGCYQTTSRASSIVAVMGLKIEKDETSFEVTFSSRKFLQFFLNGPLPLNLMKERLDNSDEAMDLEDTIEDIMKTVNRNGGWTVVGWIRQGQIVDQGVASDTSNPKAEKTEVIATKTTDHVVHVVPTNDFLKRHQRIQDMRYDANRLTEA